MTYSNEKNNCLEWPVLIYDLNKLKDQEKNSKFPTKEELTIEELLDEIAILYPHIAYKLRLLVGFREFEVEINNLVISNRNNRLGFEKSIISNFIKLYFAHINKYENITPASTDIWVV